MSNLSRLSPSRTNITNPETAIKEEPLSHLPGIPTIAPKNSHKTAICFSSGNLGWDIAVTLANLLLWIAQLYNIQGSARSSSFFLQQAANLAEDMNAPRLMAKILARQVALEILLNTDDTAQKNLARLIKMSIEVRSPALVCLQSTDNLLPSFLKDGGLSSIESIRLKAQLAMKSLQLDEAEMGYLSAQQALEKLDRGQKEMERQFSSPRKHLIPAKAGEILQFDQIDQSILPLMQSQILRSRSA